MSVPGHALRCGPETSVTSPLLLRWFELWGHDRHISSRRGRGNVGIPKGFPKSVGRVGSRLHGFPCFPYSVISMACFSRGKCCINRYAATPCNVPHSPRDAHRYSSLMNEWIGDFAARHLQSGTASSLRSRLYEGIVTTSSDSRETRRLLLG